MACYIRNGKVFIQERNLASTLMNKGSYGQTHSGGPLTLDLIEAAYLLENGRIAIKKSRSGPIADLRYLLEMGMAQDKGFMDRYIVYRDLRNRGLVAIRAGNSGFSIYRRGDRPGTGKADSWYQVYRETDSVSIKGLWIEALTRDHIRLRSVSAIVDSDWDLTYYDIEVGSQVFPEKGTGIEDPGYVIGKEDRTTIPEGGSIFWGDGKEDIHDRGFMGTEMGECLFLSNEEDRMLFARDSDEKHLKDIVYRDLSERDWYIRTGFKYGAHFRIYTSSPEDSHSSLLVHCIPEGDRMTWEEISRCVRLCHSVNKRMIFALIPEGVSDPHHEPGKVAYLSIEWFKP